MNTKSPVLKIVMSAFLKVKNRIISILICHCLSNCNCKSHFPNKDYKEQQKDNKYSKDPSKWMGDRWCLLEVFGPWWCACILYCTIPLIQFKIVLSVYYKWRWLHICSCLNGFLILNLNFHAIRHCFSFLLEIENESEIYRKSVLKLVPSL